MSLNQRRIHIKIIEEGNTITHEAITAVLMNFNNVFGDNHMNEQEKTAGAIKILFEHRRLSKLN